MGIEIEMKVSTVASAGLATFGALLVGATVAQADPGVPVPPPQPPALVAPVIPGPPVAPPPAPPVAAPAPIVPGVPAPPPAVPVAGVAPVPIAAEPAPPAEVPHLVSPENLPPGTSLTSAAPGQSNSGSYLRELWHAVQTQEVSGKDALLLLTQRPLRANTTPPSGLAANPPEQMPAVPPPPQGEPLPSASPPGPAHDPAVAAPPASTPPPPAA